MAASTSSWETAAGAVPQQQGDNQAAADQHQGNFSRLEGRRRRQNLKLHLEVQWENGLQQNKSLESTVQQIQIVFAILNQSYCDV